MTAPALSPPASLADIARQLQGYDPQALSADQVLAFLQRMVPAPEGEECLPLMQAQQRILARDVVSSLNVPPHDNSAMDGYAFDGSALQAGSPLRLRVAGTALAGAAWRGPITSGECLKIMTGAILPAGLDTVVPQEFVQLEDGATPHIHIPADLLARGDNRRLCGEDLRQGQIALHAGARLGPAALGLLASLGLPQVWVRPRLRVAYFSTGDEILSLGEPPREGAVYDSNRYTVAGLLNRLGCELIDLGVVRDDPPALQAALLQAARTADAIITSGGVSVGEADHTKRVMQHLGDVCFWRVAMRPGRPLAVGRMAPAQSRHPLGTPLFGLPGNPVAVMVTFLAFVQPALLRMMGASPAAPIYLRAQSSEVLRKKPGRTEYQRGLVSHDAKGRLQVRSTGNQGSGVLSSMVASQGLIVLHHGQGPVAVGDEVDVLMFDGAI